MGICRGEVGSVSRGTPGYVEWKIPDFLSLEAHRGDFYESPEFSASGCRWKLGGYPQGCHYLNAMELHLQLVASNTSQEINVTWTLAFKRSCGYKLGKIFFSRTFKEGNHKRFRRPYVARSFLGKSDMLPSKALTVTCCLVVHLPKSLQQPKITEPQPHSCPLSFDFDKMFACRMKCDVTLKVQEKEFKAHWFILAARSPVFNAMLEHNMSEQQTGVVTIVDCDPDSFEDFLHYLYTGLMERVSVRNVHHLYVTAHKYDVQLLVKFCSACMARNLTIENVLNVVTLARLFDDAQLMVSAQAFFNQNFQKIIGATQWEVLMKENFPIANDLLKAMRTALNVTEASKRIKDFGKAKLKGYLSSDSSQDSEIESEDSDDARELIQRGRRRFMQT